MEKKIKSIDDVKNIIDLYYKNETIKDIASKYDVNYRIVQRIILGTTYKELDRPKKIIRPTVRSSDNLAPFTSTQLDIIIGSLLGDGYIINSEKRNSYFGKTQKSKSIEHLEWIALNMVPYNKPVRSGLRKIHIDKNGVTWNPSPHSIFKTCSYSTFTEIGKKWYPEGVKIVPKDIILNPQIVAIWFCDDGINCQKHRRATICTNGFTKEDCTFLMKRLALDVGIESYLNLNKKGQPLIHIGSNYYIKFINLISPHVVWKCFDYKVDLSNYKEIKYNLEGKKLGHHKLEIEQVKEIINLRKNQKTIKEISDIFQISISHVHRIVTGKCWGGARYLE